MPELPEVETTCRGIRPLVSGREVSGVLVRNPHLRRPVSAELSAAILGERLLAVRRRAKYLLLDFRRGSVIVHLGMSGTLRVLEATEPAGRHDHVDLVFGERLLRYRDPRRFGLVLWVEGDAMASAPLAGLGPEPLGDAFTGATLQRALCGVGTPVKQALMDARRVVGIGNIYASESLFRARIHPLEAAGRIGPKRCDRLAAALRETLSAAIEAGGSTLRDFVGGDGRPGYFQQQYFVYGREGLACRVCGAPIRRVVTAQRATYFCPRCQRR